MNKNPFALSGSELLHASVGKTAAPGKEVFAKSKSGGGLGRSGKPVSGNREPEEDLIPEPAAPAPPKELPVKLSNPKWLADEAAFGDTVKVSVDIDLPASHAHLTRVSLSLQRMDAQGKKETLASADAHAKDGKVDGEFTLTRPKQVKTGEAVPFVFTASHRDAKDVESAKLKAVEPERSLVLEMDDHSGIKQDGYVLVLKDSGGAIHTSLKAGDAEEADGILTFEFENLEPDVGYVCEMRDGQGKVVEIVFSEMKHGDWKVE